LNSQLDTEQKAAGNYVSHSFARCLACFRRHIGADNAVLVLPGRRVLKGVLKVLNVLASCLEINVSTAGTKRRRTVKSGADQALLEDDGEEEDDDDENIPRKTPVNRPELSGAQPPIEFAAGYVTGPSLSVMSD